MLLGQRQQVRLGLGSLVGHLLGQRIDRGHDLGGLLGVDRSRTQRFPGLVMTLERLGPLHQPGARRTRQPGHFPEPGRRVGRA
jgi:hypothetical protein